jgi:hypothetical protein
MVHGLDISHWQSVTPPLGAQDFVFVRATYGTSRDGRYAQHAANVRRAGKVLGAYHFGRAGSVVSVDAQVTAFLAVGAGADLLVLDQENDAGWPDMTMAEASHVIAEVRRRTGRGTLLYHSLSGFPLRLGQSGNWVAKWSPTPPSIPWVFWQYTSDGSLPGYTGRLDMNRFNGSLAELRALAGEQQQGETPVLDFFPMGGGDGVVTIKEGRGLVNLVTGKAVLTDDLVKTSHCRIHLAEPFGDAPGRQDGYLVRHSQQAHVALDDVVASFVPTATPEPASVTYPVTVGGKSAGSVTLP